MFLISTIFFQGEAERLSLCALLHAKHHRGAIAQRTMQRKLSCRETPRPAHWGVGSVTGQVAGNVSSLSGPTGIFRAPMLMISVQTPTMMPKET